MPKTLRLILGDQLNVQHSWFRKKDEAVTYVMMETRSETDYVRHHIQKILGFFQSMRNFNEALTAVGHQTVYLKISDPQNEQSITQNLERLIDESGFERFEYQLPDEWRLDRQLQELCEKLSIETQAADTEHFFTHRDELKEQFEGKKMILMESFYRKMRKKHGILMTGSEPETGRWNYDAENRKKLPKGHTVVAPKLFQHDLSALLTEIEAAGVQSIGNVDAQNFTWPLTRKEGQGMLQFFVEHCLAQFGDYQDAMDQEEWSLYHSRLSFSMNSKMLSPREVIDAVIEHWRAHDSEISISQVEGFVRQILGWREYMRGIYWWKMPEFGEMNFFEHDRKLPSWFWTGETKMNCMKRSINNSLDNAYAHHIQRLMVTGNFALLAGIDPDEVDAWYLGIYIDAIEWVEITNTRGMSQFADGGIVGTKPYTSSANYIHKMGNYCGHCHYSRTEKTGEKACPFNSLYWHFYNRNRAKLERNPHIGMMYRTWDKMDVQKREDYLNQAEKYLSDIEYI